MAIMYDLVATVALPPPGGLQEISFEFETNSLNAGTILWALASATLGAYISFTLLAQSKPEERIVPLKHRASLLILAALSLTFGCCACQLLTSRASLEPLQNSHVAPFIAFRLSFVALSVCIPAIVVASAFFLLSFWSKCGSDGDDKLLAWKCLACGLLVGLSGGMNYDQSVLCTSCFKYSPYLSLPYFNATFDPGQTFLVFLLNVSGSLLSFLATAFYVNKVQMPKRTTILLHLLISLIFGACIIGAGMLAHLGMRFEPKGKGATEESNEFDRKQRDVLTLAIPAVISVVLTCASVRFIFAGNRLNLWHWNTLKRPPSPRLTFVSIAFSRDGRILVNQKGMLPMESVDLQGLPDNILDELDSHTSMFHWLLAISFDWSIISPFVQHINHISVLRDKQIPSSSSSSALWRVAVSSVSPLSTSLLTLFHSRSKSHSPSSSSHAVSGPVPVVQAKARLKLRLLAAASQLATQLDIPLEELGSLHERALETGSRIGIGEFLRISEHASAASRSQQLLNQSLDSVETAIKANVETGRELMLFFVRSLSQHFQHQNPESQYSPSESAQPSSGIQKPRPRSSDSGKSGQVESPSGSNSVRRLQQQQQQHHYPPSGFKMRFMGRCCDVLTETTGVKPADVDKIFNGCKNTALKRSCSVLEAGCTYVSLLVDKVSCDGLPKVLVYEFAKHQLPSYKVNLLAFTQEVRTWLRDMSGFTALDIMQICKYEVEQGRLGLLPKRSRSHPRRTRQRHPFDVSASLYEDEREDEDRNAILLHFKHALRTAVAQLMRDLSFVGEGLETWTYLTPHVLDVPSSCDADSSDGSVPSSAHMIVLHAELPDPLDVVSLEDEVESGFTHHSSTCRSSLSSSAARDHRGSMPSVFEYIPRTLFDVLHTYFISPESTRGAFREQATKELDVLTSLDEEETTLTMAASQPGRGSGPGRLPRALVSSFSIDSIDDDDDEGRSSRNGDRNLTAATANLQKSWEAVKSYARALSLLPPRRKRVSRRKNDRNPIPIPFSHSASRMRLRLHSNSGSSPMAAATSTGTADCYYDKDCRVATSKVSSESDNYGVNNSRRLSTRSKAKSRSLSRSEARKTRWEGFEDGGTAMSISNPLPVPRTPFRSHTHPHLESDSRRNNNNNKASIGNRAAWKSVPNVAVSTTETTRGGFF